MSGDEIRNRILSPETLVPVGVLLTILIPLLAFTWTASATFTEFRNDIAGIKEVINKNRWTYYMERTAWQEFQLYNVDLKIPDVQRIRTDSHE